MLQAAFLEDINLCTPIEKISQSLDQEMRHAIACRPWPEFGYKPEVSFAIAHGKNAILLKFFVTEEAIRAVYLNPNDPVYLDSCVEFFIGFNDDADYYNFEFNCAGTCLLGYGSGRERQLLPVAEIRKIKHESRIRNPREEKLIDWELTVVIPTEVMIFHHFSSLNKSQSRVNFFKCGDGLPKPHYLSWNNIESDEPNFHQSQFFGSLYFQ
ncbi:hypothetical protein LPB86_00430 [Pedobacter sp. MC2016-14]|uniref:carbohydrate-binding family 9-like protein n=1 Tax=Pedobacter sp. MC2016-14 TaxID=2897327 RepID=UPI001E34E1A4|nr:carbohydrate-binding family 9-like protein [Pedobacter sp. MC2016-14]MCD0486676.1 hypothetical protein [Pedobacter sp. MC2016-14]